MQPLSASENEKVQSLEPHRETGDNKVLTTNHGVKINDDQNSLKAGARGATLLEDFILREKITHFDHERIPERIVHARGSAAHGVFKLYESQAVHYQSRLSYGYDDRNAGFCTVFNCCRIERLHGSGT